jgi:acyl-CoA synthetase (AMP-forming)/AMP-acid ligase II
MSAARSLDRYLADSARTRGDHPAIEKSDHSISYRELSELSDRVSCRLREQGIQSKDRVGIYLHKSIDRMASIFGILKSGATYVPVHPLAPASRNAYIFNNCAVKTIVVEGAFAGDLATEMG